MKKKKPQFKRKDVFRSGLEADISKRLPKNTSFESEKLSYYIPKKYIPDFIIPTRSGKKIYLEVKGYLRYEDQQKMRHVKMCNPELDIRFFFPNDNKVMGSKMTNSEWCRKHGFPYAIGKFPKGWWK